MKDEAHLILGKTIIGVYIKYAIDPHNSPRSQLMLLFSDNSVYEFYAPFCDLRPTGGIKPNGGVEHIYQYMKDGYFFAYQASINPVTGESVYESHDR